MTGPRATASDSLYEFLCCPHDQTSPLSVEDTHLLCPACRAEFPIRDGIVSFLAAQELSDQLDRERRSRDEESSWYDTMFEGYTNSVEVPSSVRRIGQPDGPILDAGCGTGRITKALLPLGQPIVAVDYSEASLRILLRRVEGSATPVLAVQSDVRALPIRSGTMAAGTCIEVYAQLRAEDRRRLLSELHRVLEPGAALSISAYNLNLLFRAWQVVNPKAREGEHMLGGDFYYIRLKRQEFRRELEELFDIEELTGIRNIPARSIAGAFRRGGLGSTGDPVLEFMIERGHRADVLIERTPLAGLTGFFWLAKARPKPSGGAARGAGIAAEVARGT